MGIILEIFKGRELTVSYFDKQIGESKLYHQSAICTLDKWSRNRPPIDVPVELFKLLIEYRILELDSGNFETGEEHYILSNIKAKEIEMTEFSYNYIAKLAKPVLREVRLNKLLK